MENNRFVYGIYVNNGTPNAPSFSFIGDPSTGFTRNENGFLEAIVRGNPVANFYLRYFEITQGFKMPQNAKENHIMTSDSEGFGAWKINPTQSGSIKWNSLYKNINPKNNEANNSISINLPEYDNIPNIVHSIESNNYVADNTFYIKNKTASNFTLYSTLPILHKINNKELEYFSICRLKNDCIGICYYDTANDKTCYIYSLDVLGKEWSDEIIPDNVSCIGPLDLQLVGDYPAIAYMYDDGAVDEWRFIRASNELGSSWDSPITLATSTGDLNFLNSSINLRIVNLNPAVFYNDANGRAKIIRATNASGSSWAEPVNISNLTNHQIMDVIILNSNPAVCARSNITNAFYFVRSTNNNGSSWPIGATQLYKYPNGQILANTGKGSCTMNIINGKLCVVLSELNTNMLYINVSIDDIGSAWNGFINIASPIGELSYPKIFLNNNTYYILYNYSNSNPSLKGLIKILDDNVTLFDNIELLSTFSYCGDNQIIKNVNDGNNLILFNSENNLSILRFYEDDFKINWISHSF